MVEFNDRNNLCAVVAFVRYEKICREPTEVSRDYDIGNFIGLLDT